MGEAVENALDLRVSLGEEGSGANPVGMRFRSAEKTVEALEGDGVPGGVT